MGLTLDWGAFFPFVIGAFFFVVFFFAIASCGYGRGPCLTGLYADVVGDQGARTHRDGAADGRIRLRAEALYARGAPGLWRVPTIR